MTIGIVKFFNVAKGFGFVTSDAGEDFYFNKASLRRDRPYDPVEGDQISFETRDGKQGKIAHHIEQVT